MVFIIHIHFSVDVNRHHLPIRPLNGYISALSKIMSSLLISSLFDSTLTTYFDSAQSSRQQRSCINSDACNAAIPLCALVHVVQVD